MSDEFDLNDERLFDRLVDGELSPAQRRQLLASLDDRTSGWRRCALAFLEAQAWRRELSELTDGTAGPKAATTSEPAAATGFSRPRWHGVSWYALAASLLIAFTLGLALGYLPHPHRNRAPNPFNHQVASVIPDQPGAESGIAPPTDALTLWVRDETGEARPLRVPLVDANALDGRMGLEFQSGMPAAVRDRLERSGFHVESKRRYAPLWLENGRPFVLPVEDTLIVPVSNLVY